MSHLLLCSTHFVALWINGGVLSSLYLLIFHINVWYTSSELPSTKADGFRVQGFKGSSERRFIHFTRTLDSSAPRILVAVAQEKILK
jgi:hypothetical protein